MEKGSGAGAVAPHVTSQWTLILVFLALTGLTLLTVRVAYIDLGAWNTPSAVLIATVKASLVVVIFMEMRFGQRLTWLAAAGGILFLLLLIGLTMADVDTRSWMGVPGR